MQLTIKREQADVKGLFGGHKGVNFSLYGRCDITPEEKSLIAKYKVGEYVLAEYQIKGLDHLFQINVNGIVSGQSVTTGDINTLLALEGEMKQGCGNLKKLLTVLATFGGEEIFEI